MNRRALALPLALVAAGCGSPTENPSDGPDACATGTAASAASAPDRRLLGTASRYPADLSYPARAEEFRRSQRARRAAAWEVMARVVAPVIIPGMRATQSATVPRFRTWYDREDLARVFQRLYENLGPAGRADRARFSEADLDAAFGWNATFVDSLDTWTPTRWDEYLREINSPEALAGLGGLRRIWVSPDAARHLVQSYPEVLRCLEGARPPAFSDGPAQSEQRLARDPISLGRCASHTSGPFFVARGARITARVEGDTGGATTLALIEGSTRATGTTRCTAAGSVGCALDGPGVFYVDVRTAGRAGTGALEVRHTAPQPAVASCLAGVFPVAAATVAMEWRRANEGWTFPIYDSDAPALARRYAQGRAATWGAGDRNGAPSAAEIYTMQLPGGARYRLAGMHIRTREVDHWMNITLWYSDTPDSDFGADRTPSVQALGAPWTSYKMCVTTEFDERDPDPGGGFDRDAPSLAAALRVVHEGFGGPSWCSNPYIDGGPGLVRSNCVGCHQHAMTGARAGETVNDESRYPSLGRAQVRNNFPADQFWGLDGGDDFAAIFAETAAYWRTAR